MRTFPGFSRRTFVVWFISFGLFAFAASSAFAQAPAFTLRPLSKVAIAGQAVSFTAGATGAAPLAYQWKRNGQVIAGATGSTLDISNSAYSDKGWYQVAVSNASGSAKSVVMLTVVPANSAVVSWPNSTGVPAGLGNAVALAQGVSHALALRADGTVTMWGRYSDYGEIAVPVGLSGVIAVAAGQDASLALKGDGTVVAWGRNIEGQATVPAGLAGVIAIAAGNLNSFALKADGTVVAWGKNFADSAVVPPGLSDVVGIAAGSYHSMALKSDGTVTIWGGAGSDQSTVPAGLSGVIAIDAGDYYGVALKSDGTVAGWGLISSGTVPAGLSGVTAVSAGKYHAIALKTDGTVVTWGGNDSGQTIPVPAGLANVVAISAGGNGDLALIPVSVPTITTPPVSQTGAIGQGASFSVTTSSSLQTTYQWTKNGANLTNGGNIFGSTSATLVVDPVAVTDAGSYAVVVTNAAGSVTSSAGALSVVTPPTITSRPLSRLASVGQAIALSISATDSGPLTYQWRRNGRDLTGATDATWSIASATLADQGTYEVVVRNAVASVRSVLMVNLTTFPVDATTVVAWGPASYVPPDLTNMVSLSSQWGYSAAVRSDGTVAAWPNNGVSGWNFPAGLGDVVAVSVGSNHAIALKADGTLVVWGDYTSSWLPIPAGLRDVVAVTAGYDVALKADGTIVSWNPFVSAPPAGLSGVVALSSGSGALALKADGTVVGWGTQPAPVPSDLTNATAISAGGYHNMALRADGTVVVWGLNSDGQLDVPAGLSGVVSIAAGVRHCLAAKADGTVVAWGKYRPNAVTVDPSPPLGLAQVVAVAAGEFSSSALVAVGAPTVIAQPAGSAVNVGKNVTLSVVAGGVPFPTYRWKKGTTMLTDSGNFSGTATAQLTITNAQLTDSGDYSVTVTNSLGSVTSNPAALVVATPPAVVSRPLSRIVKEGDSVSFTIASGGSEPLVYQWKRNGQLIASATTATLNLTAVSRADSGFYEVVVTNLAGGVVRSFLNLAIAKPEQAVRAWSNAGVLASLGDSLMTARRVVSLSSGNSHDLALLDDGTVEGWQENASGLVPAPAGLSGVVAVSASYGHSLALKADGTVVAWGANHYGQTTVPPGLSNVIAVAATPRRSLAVKADGLVVAWGDTYYDTSVALTGLENVVAVAGGDTWGVALKADGSVRGWGRGDNGEINIPASLANVRAISSGSSHTLALRSDGTVVAWGSPGAAYSTVPSNLIGVVAVSASPSHSLALKADGSIVAFPTSVVIPAGLGYANAVAAGSARSLAVIPALAPAIVTQPAHQPTAPGGTATFAVAANGTPPLSFQWSRNGVALAGATASTLTIPGAQFANAGNYSVTVTNAFGVVTSNPAILGGINPVPVITSPPQPVSVVAGQAVVLAVAASGVGPFTYQWRRGGTDLPGATGTTLNLGAAALALNGSYDVVIADGLSRTVSVPVTVQVAPNTYPQVLTLDQTVGAAFEEAGGNVNALVRTADGRVLVVGDFSRVHGTPGRNLGWLKADGSGATALTPLAIDGPIFAAALQTDGKIIIGGTFRTVGGQSRAGLARLNATGSLDLSFVPSADFTGVFALAVQPGGKIVVGGAFSSRLARVSSEGATDRAFAPAPNSSVYALLALPDGRVLAGGAFTQIAGQVSSAIARLNDNGTLDASFAIGAGFNGIVYALKGASSDRVVAGGGFTSYNGTAAGRIVRLTSGGAIDSGWSTGGSGFNSTVYSVDVQSDGKVVAAGAFGGFNTTSQTAVARLLSTGALDSGFRVVTFTQAAVAVTYLDNGSVVAGGSFVRDVGFGTTATGIALLNAVGTVGFSYSPGLMKPSSVNKIVRLADGRVVAGGPFVYVNGVSAPYLASLSATGVLDTTFATNEVGRPSAPIEDMLIQPDGKLVIVGDFWAYRTTFINKIARINSDGSVDPQFQPPSFLGGIPDRVAQLPGGRLLLAVKSGTTISGAVPRRDSLIALYPDGTVDPGFTVTPIPSGEIFAMLVQSDGKIVVGGSFRTFNGAPCDFIVRLLPSGARDASFVARTDDNVRAFALQPDGKILLAGDFFAVDDVVRARVARLQASGELDATFTPQFVLNASPTLLALEPGGRILVSGPFDYVNNHPVLRYLFRALANGALDSSFSAPGLTTPVANIVMTEDGSPWLAGGELQLGGLARHGVMRALSTAGPLILAQPSGAIVPAGAALSFSISVAGGENVSYQWLKNGAAISGATSPSLSSASLQVGDAGNYVVRITHGGGTVDSTTAVLAVNPSAPILASNDVTGFGGAIKSGSRWALVAPAVAAGSPPITYQWSKDGVAITGATARTYWMPGWQSADDGVYRVLVSNGSGASNSNPFAQHVTTLPDWNWRLPLPQGNSLFAMTYLNGRFMGGGSRGTVLASPDGAAWTVSRLGVSNSVVGFAYGNGTYMAVTSYGGIWTSSDATAWTQRDAEVGADGRYFSSVAFGAGRFVAVGDRGLIATSSNGVTWSAAAAGTTDNLGAISFGGGRFVTLGSSGRALVSADGVSWSAGGVLRRPASLLAYGAGRFVAINGKQLFTSADGQSWTQQTLDTTASATGLQFTDVGFLLTLDSTDGKYWSSATGLDWSRHSMGLTQNAAAQTLAHGANRYVMAGLASESLITSSDGLAWERNTPSFALNFIAAAAGPNSLVAIGQRAAVKISADGSITSQALNLSDYDKPMDIVFGAGMYVAVFSAGSVWTSADGQSWSGSTNSSQSYTGVSFANDRFFVLGTNGLMLTSPSAGAPTASTGTGQTLFKTAYGAGVYVTVGASGTVLTSTNGTAWTTRNANGITSNIYDVVYAAGKFVLVSEGASIRTSLDGVTWTAQVNPLGAGLKSLVFGGGKFFAFTTSNTNYLTSPDGVTWTVAQHGSTNSTADAVVFGNNLYLVGANASITSAALAAPAIAVQPVAQSKVANDTVSFTVGLSDSGPFAYQWLRNGVAIVGANFATLTLNNITAADAGAYTVSVTNHGGTTTSSAASLAIESRGLITSAARANVGTGSAALTGVFSVEGSGSKQMLLRAVGPALASIGISGTLIDPQLVVEDLATGATVASNDDWGTAANAVQTASTAALVGAMPFAAGSKDAAVLATFVPGTYRVRVVGAGATTGVASLEIYDADSTPRLVYLATRAQVGAGSDAFVQGFSLSAVSPGRTYLIRALGPTLGLPGALLDPQLTVFSGATQLATNDNWGGDGALSTLATAVGAMALPTTSKDAALNFTPAAAGAFTVQVGGVAGATGLTLLEIFEADAQRAASVPLAVVSAPENVTINAGQATVLGVVAVGKPAPTFQWSKNGTPIGGATNSLIAFPRAQAIDSGTYSVFVTNGGATAINSTAALAVAAINNAAHGVLGGGYAPGGAVTITNTLHYVGVPTALEWTTTLPAGWTLLADGGATGDVRPATNASGTLTWRWTTPPPSPVTFTYTAAVPATESVARALTATAGVTISGAPQTFPPAPTTLTLRPSHSADTDGDGRVGLFELTRVIELYNTRSGTTRTGRYLTQVGTEDGFAPDSAGAGAPLHQHAADTNRDGRLALVELTRVIELFNTRSGTARTGAYRVASTPTEDGFAPGP